VYGETITLDFLRAPGKPVVLLFSDPGCGPCNMLLPEVGRWQRDYAGKLTLALISRGSVEANRTKASEHGITQVLLQKDRETAEAYRDQGTPGAVLVRPDGMIGTPLALGADAIRALVAGAVGLPVLQALPAAALTNGNGNGHHNGNGSLPIVKQTVPTAGSKEGTRAPDFSLPDLSGKLVSLSTFRGSKTLVLFWNPGCGFCQRMLDDLKAWEANPPTEAPKLLIISTGTVEANQALGLRASVLLDQNNMSVGSKFGANGTPMAVLIDTHGNLASEVVVGAPAVLALANGKDPALANNNASAPVPAAPARPQMGEPAPAFALPNLAGKPVNLSDFRGNRTLVLFWNPGCGFCQRMLDDLKAWEAHPPAGSPRLLVVSTGSVESNRELGLRSTIVLDQNMSVGSKFGANGTPMAVLVDGQGRIASELAVGAPAVMALAGTNKDQSTVVSV
jgi:thiol-disulfide isomerase/thioredoxin